MYIYIYVSLFCTPRSVSFIPLNYSSLSSRLTSGCQLDVAKETEGEGTRGRRPFSRLILARFASTGTCSESKLFIPSFPRRKIGRRFNGISPWLRTIKRVKEWFKWFLDWENCWFGICLSFVLSKSLFPLTMLKDDYGYRVYLLRMINFFT